ncbi:MAG: EamA family transporter, partial [Alkalicoccus sp.]
MSTRAAYLIVMAGAALWGTTGLFVNQLNQAGFTAWEVVGIRLSFSALLLLLFLLIFHRGLLYVKLRDLPFFIGTGII